MDLGQKWVKSFYIPKKLRVLEFNRVVMPRNTSFPKLNLTADGDTAKEHVKTTTVREGILTIVTELRLLLVFWKRGVCNHNGKSLKNYQ